METTGSDSVKDGGALIRLQFGMKTVLVLVTLVCLWAAWAGSRNLRHSPAPPAAAAPGDGSVLRGSFTVSITEQVTPNSTTSGELRNIVEIRFYPQYVVLVRSNGSGSLHAVEKLRSLRWRASP